MATLTGSFSPRREQHLQIRPFFGLFQTKLPGNRAKHRFGGRPLLGRRDDFHLDEAAQLFHVVAADFKRETVSVEMVGNPPLADDGDRSIAEVDDQPAEGVRGVRAAVDRQLDLRARLGRPALLGPLVGDAIAFADAAQPERLVGFCEIPIGGVGVRCFLVELPAGSRAPLRQPLHDRVKVGDRELHFDLEHNALTSWGTAILTLYV
jgi:hypothetical protein